MQSTRPTAEFTSSNYVQCTRKCGVRVNMSRLAFHTFGGAKMYQFLGTCWPDRVYNTRPAKDAVAICRHWQPFPEADMLSLPWWRME